MTLFFQALLDALESNNQDPDLLLLKELCVTLDDEDRWGVHHSVRALTAKKLIVRHDFTLLYKMVELHHHEIHTRMILLGMGDAFRAYRLWHFTARFDGPSFVFPDTKPINQGVISPDWVMDIWKPVVDDAMNAKPSRYFRSAKITWQSLNLILVGLLIEISNSSKSIQSIYLGDIRRSYPHIIGRIIWRIKIIFQQILDAAPDELVQGNSSNISRLKSLLIALHKNLTTKKLLPSIFALQIELTRRGEIQLIKMKPSELDQMTSGGKYFDAPVLKKHAKRREMIYTHFDENGADVDLPEHRIRLADFLETCWRQIDFLLLIYGQLNEENYSHKQFEQQYRIRRIINRPLSLHDKGSAESGGARLPLENDRRRRILAAMPKENRLLESDDDWVEYVVALFKFENRQKSPKDDIWLSVMQDFRNYFGAFTASTKFNLRDIGTSYLALEKKIPRAITGQKLHDCGVYAVRLSYILLQAGHRIDAGKTADDDNALKLSITFIVLPNHVGLIIRGNNLTSFITHNGAFTPIPEDRLVAFEKTWRKLDREGKIKSTPSVNIDEEQFWAEIAAPFFISGVNVPYLMVKIPGADLRPAVTKRKIWEAYKLVVCAPDRDRRKQCGKLFNPDNPEQINLLYLEVTKKKNKLYNRYLVPIWNVLWFNTWNKNNNSLNRAYTAARKSPLRAKGFLDLKQDYVEEINSSLSEMSADLKDILLAKEEIDSKLADDRKVLHKGIKHTWAKRLNLKTGPLFMLAQYMKEINPVDADGNPTVPEKFEPPPFGEVKNRLRRTPM